MARVFRSGRHVSPLVVELAEERDAACDPVFLRVLAGDRQADDEVGGVSGGGEDAPPLTRLVHRGEVGRPLRNVHALTRPRPDLTQSPSTRSMSRVVQSTRAQCCNIELW